MFLLMGIGYLVAVSVLVSEIVGGCAKRCRQFARRNSKAVFPSSFRPDRSNRESFVSQSEHPTISSQEKFRRLVLRHFRRDSEQPESTVDSNEYQNRPKKHSRSGSVSFMTDQSISFGVSESTVNERRTKNRRESDICQVSKQDEIAEYDGSANSSNHITPNFETDRIVDVHSKDCGESEGEFGEIIEN